MSNQPPRAPFLYVAIRLKCCLRKVWSSSLSPEDSLRISTPCWRRRYAETVFALKILGSSECPITLSSLSLMTQKCFSKFRTSAFGTSGTRLESKPRAPLNCQRSSPSLPWLHHGFCETHRHLKDQKDSPAGRQCRMPLRRV